MPFWADSKNQAVTVEIFKNPSKLEINNIIKNDYVGDVRLVYTKDGDVYAWGGNLIVHNDVFKNYPELKKKAYYTLYYDAKNFLLRHDNLSEFDIDVPIQKQNEIMKKMKYLFPQARISNRLLFRFSKHKGK